MHACQLGLRRVLLADKTLKRVSFSDFILFQNEHTQLSGCTYVRIIFSSLLFRSRVGGTWCSVGLRRMEASGAKVERLVRLYPKVDESETPLPRAWSAKDKYTYIGLSQGNLRVHYKGTGRLELFTVGIHCLWPCSDSVSPSQVVERTTRMPQQFVPLSQSLPPVVSTTLKFESSAKAEMGTSWQNSSLYPVVVYTHPLSPSFPLPPLLPSFSLLPPLPSLSLSSTFSLSLLPILCLPPFLSGISVLVCQLLVST